MPTVEDVKQVAKQIGDGIDSMKQSYDEKFKSIEQELTALKRPSRSGGSNRASVFEGDQKSAFKSFVRKGEADELLALEQKAMSVTSDPDGGYAVPEVVDQEIENLELAASAMMKLARVVEANGPVYKKLVNARGTASGWVGETEGRPETGTPTLHEVNIPLGEIYANPKLTQQLIDDAFFDAEGFITSEIGEEFSDKMGAAFITGDGVSKPKGILSYTVTDEADGERAFGTLQAVETGTASAVDFDDLKALKSALKAKYRADACWIMNEETALALSKIKDADGQYIWRDSVAKGDPDTLFGYPVELDKNMPDIADDAFPVAFGNFKRGYFIPRRFGTRLLRDPFTSKPYVNFYATARIGGGVVNSEAIKLLKIQAA